MGATLLSSITQSGIERTCCNNSVLLGIMFANRDPKPCLSHDVDGFGKGFSAEAHPRLDGQVIACHVRGYMTNALVEWFLWKVVHRGPRGSGNSCRRSNWEEWISSWQGAMDSRCYSPAAGVAKAKAERGSRSKMKCATEH